MPTGRERLKERITNELKASKDAPGWQDSFAIAQKYEGQGYELAHDEIRALVREIAQELGVQVS